MGSWRCTERVEASDAAGKKRIRKDPFTSSRLTWRGRKVRYISARDQCIKTNAKKNNKQKSNENRDIYGDLNNE